MIILLLMNGDVLTDLNYKELYNYHLQNEALCTIAIYQKQVK